MPRKDLRVQIETEGRDFGKIFVLREMPADQAERWFYRFVLALANAGAKVPEEILFAGAAGFADLMPSLRNSLVVSIRALQGLAYAEVLPLLEEMKPFIRYQPPGTPPPPEQEIFPGVNSQIDEVSTWIKLRFELIQLHVGFSLAGAVSTSRGETPPQEATA